MRLRTPRGALSFPVSLLLVVSIRSPGARRQFRHSLQFCQALLFSPSLSCGFYPRAPITNLFSLSLPLVLEFLLSSPDIPGATSPVTALSLSSGQWHGQQALTFLTFTGEDDMNSCCGEDSVHSNACTSCRSDDGEKHPLLLLSTPQLKH